MRKLLSAYSVLLCLVSCDMDYLAVSKPEYVVEGWIESGEHPLVMVSKTIPADGKARSVRDLGEFVVEMAHVAVIDETTGKNYTLVGHLSLIHI